MLDGSWYLPGSARNAAAEYAAGHIPGAVFFDLDAHSDGNTPLPHMLPVPEVFARQMAELGLNDHDDLVVYDGSGANLSAARVWWTFRVLGHPRVAVLDGGLGKWVAEQRPIEQGVVTSPKGRFTARLERGAIRDLAAMRDNVVHPREQVIDARPRRHDPS